MSAVNAPARILVVEDDDSLRTAVATTLRAEGFVVAEAPDGRTIAEDLDRTAPDLVLLDWMLPGPSGILLAARIRARSDAAVVMTTARDELDDRLRGFAESAARTALAAADDVHRNVEFLADLAELGDNAVSRKVRGVIDLLYRDAAGWHVLGIDPGRGSEDDPWRGRRAAMILQAWAVSKQLGSWPATIELFDLATGQLVRADPQRFPLAAAAEQFLRR